MEDVVVLIDREQGGDRYLRIMGIVAQRIYT